MYETDEFGDVNDLGISLDIHFLDDLLYWWENPDTPNFETVSCSATTR